MIACMGFPNLNRTVIMAALALAMAFAEPLSQTDRDKGMSHFHATRKVFLDSVAGLSDAQWNFKPGPQRWSIAECAEHIAVSEDAIFEMVQQVLRLPAEPGKKAMVRGKDEMILRTMPDRSVKAQAPEFLQPKRRWPDRQSLIAHFKESRDRNIAYLQTTGDDLRGHFLEHPAFKTLDTYQMMLLISAHCERHTLQIDEVKTAPNFPKN